ncbi:hypothetical protein HK102_008076, partial [Quaeritorhiza haematococci]
QTIRDTFQNGNTLCSMLDQLKSGALTLEKIKPIDIVKWQGTLVSLDNRRLFVFQRFGRPIKAHIVPPSREVIEKFGAGTGGHKSVWIRRDKRSSHRSAPLPSSSSSTAAAALSLIIARKRKGKTQKSPKSSEQERPTQIPNSGSSSSATVAVTRTYKPFFTEITSWTPTDLRNTSLYTRKLSPIPSRFDSVDAYFDAFYPFLFEEVRACILADLERICMEGGSAGASGVVNLRPVSMEIGASVEDDDDSLPAASGLVAITCEFTLDPEALIHTNDVVFVGRNRLSSIEDLVFQNYAIGVVRKTVEPEQDGEESGVVVKIVMQREQAEGIGLVQEKGNGGPVFFSFGTNLVTAKRVHEALVRRHIPPVLHSIIRASAPESSLYPNEEDGNKEDDTAVVYDLESHMSRKLNDSQVQAVCAAVTRSKRGLDFNYPVLLHGPPGTGKTSVIVRILLCLLKFDLPAFQVAPTNIAVGEIAKRLLHEVDRLCTSNPLPSFFSTRYIRSKIILVGAEESIDPALMDIYLPARCERLKQTVGRLAVDLETLKQIFLDFEGYYRRTVESDRSEENDGVEGGAGEEEDEDVGEEKKVDYYNLFQKMLKEGLKALSDGIETLETCLPYSLVHLFEEDLEVFRKTLKVLTSLSWEKQEQKQQQQPPVHTDATHDFTSTLWTINGVSALYTQHSPSSPPNFDRLMDEMNSCELAQLMSMMGRISTYTWQDVIVSEAKVVFSTISSAGKAVLEGFYENLNTVVIDEASQCVEADTLIVLRNTVRSLVLVGDEKQLPATVISTEATSYGYDRSMFDRLKSMSFPSHLLNIQYRMHPHISSWPRKMFYDNNVQDAHQVFDELAIAAGPSQPIGGERRARPAWVDLPGLWGNYAFLRVEQGKEQRGGRGLRSFRNVVQAMAVVQILRTLMDQIQQHDVARTEREGAVVKNVPITIAIIPPYRAQIECQLKAIVDLAKRNKLRLSYLQKETPSTRKKTSLGKPVRTARIRPEPHPTIVLSTPHTPLHIDIRTVDGFQGQERDFVIFTTVRANAFGDIGFLRDVRRLNVALTRARFALYVVGDVSSLTRGASSAQEGEGKVIWKALVDDARERSVLFHFNLSGETMLLLDTSDAFGEYNSSRSLGSRPGLTPGSTSVTPKVLMNRARKAALTSRVHVLFKDTPWKIHVAKAALDQLKKFQEERQEGLKSNVMLVLRNLAEGFKKKSVRKGMAVGGFERFIKITDFYEYRILWTLALDTVHDIQVQVLKVWSIVHKTKIDTELKLVEQTVLAFDDAYLKKCSMLHFLDNDICVPKTFTDTILITYSKRTKVPTTLTVSVSTDEVSNQSADNATSTAETHIMDLHKTYHFTPTAVYLLSQNRLSEVDLPFTLSPEEKQLVEFNGSAFILGRSGTGKTSVIEARMLQREGAYLKWRLETVQNAGAEHSEEGEDGELGYRKPRQLMVTKSPRLCAAIKEHYGKLCGALKAEIQMAHQAEVNEDGSSEGLMKSSGSSQSSLIASVSKMGDQSAGRSGSKIVATNNSMLLHVALMNEEVNASGQALKDIDSAEYPLIITFNTFLNMVDATLECPFFEGKQDTVKAPVRINEYGAEDENGGYSDDEGDYTPGAGLYQNEGDHAEGLDDEGQDGYEMHLFGQEVRPRRGRRTYRMEDEITFKKFLYQYWPRFNQSLTKKLSPEAVWTEIYSVIKGSADSLLSHLQTRKFMPRQEYVAPFSVSSSSSSSTSSAASSYTESDKENIYAIFEAYEKMKEANGGFDLADATCYIFGRLVTEGFKGDLMDYVYLDEVQDLTPAQIALFRFVSRDLSSFVFAGDTAQTISAVNFRFADIRALFFKQFVLHFRPDMREMYGRDAVELERAMGRHVPPVHALTQNYRSHERILALANSVVNLLLHFFPNRIDKLPPERALMDGPIPVFLEDTSATNLIVSLFGKGESSIEFGAEQAIIVRDEKSREHVRSLVPVAVILTVLESKGLEFEDVLIYDFFSDSDFTRWHVLTKGQDDEDDPSRLPSGYFDGKKNELLCSELKNLYVAATRARQQLWFFDESSDRRKPMLTLWERQGLIRVVDSTRSGHLLTPLARKSTPKKWEARGRSLFEKNLFKQALMAFERANSKPDMDLCNAFLALEAGEEFEGRGKDAEAKKQFEIAGGLFSELGVWRKAGQAFERSQKYRLAAEEYLKCPASSTSVNQVRKDAERMCLKVKDDVDLADQFLRHWSMPSKEVDAFCRRYALHFHQRRRPEVMKDFLDKIDSKTVRRSFLKRYKYWNELEKESIHSGDFTYLAEVYESEMKDEIKAAELWRRSGCDEKYLGIALKLARVCNASRWLCQNTAESVKIHGNIQKVLREALDFSRKTGRRNPETQRMCEEMKMHGTLLFEANPTADQIAETLKVIQTKNVDASLDHLIVFFEWKALDLSLKDASTNAYADLHELLLKCGRYQNNVLKIGRMLQQRFPSDAIQVFFAIVPGKNPAEIDVNTSLADIIVRKYTGIQQRTLAQGTEHQDRRMYSVTTGTLTKPFVELSTMLKKIIIRRLREITNGCENILKRWQGRLSPCPSLLPNQYTIRCPGQTCTFIHETPDARKKTIDRIGMKLGMISLLEPFTSADPEAVTYKSMQANILAKFLFPNVPWLHDTLALSKFRSTGQMMMLTGFLKAVEEKKHGFRLRDESVNSICLLRCLALYAPEYVRFPPVDKEKNLIRCFEHELVPVRKYQTNPLFVAARTGFYYHTNDFRYELEPKLELFLLERHITFLLAMNSQMYYHTALPVRFIQEHLEHRTSLLSGLYQQQQHRVRGLLRLLSDFLMQFFRQDGAPLHQWFEKFNVQPLERAAFTTRIAVLLVLIAISCWHFSTPIGNTLSGMHLLRIQHLPQALFEFKYARNELTFMNAAVSLFKKIGEDVVTVCWDQRTLGRQPWWSRTWREICVQKFDGAGNSIVQFPVFNETKQATAPPLKIITDDERNDDDNDDRKVDDGGDDGMDHKESEEAELLETQHVVPELGVARWIRQRLLDIYTEIRLDLAADSPYIREARQFLRRSLTTIPEGFSKLYLERGPPIRAKLGSEMSKIEAFLESWQDVFKVDAKGKGKNLVDADEAFEDLHEKADMMMDLRESLEEMARALAPNYERFERTGWEEDRLRNLLIEAESLLENVETDCGKLLKKFKRLRSKAAPSRRL